MKSSQPSASNSADRLSNNPRRNNPRPHRVLRTCFAAATVIFWLMTPALLATRAANAESTGTVPPFADALPATIACCLWSHDVRQTSDSWHRTALYHCYASQAMGPFREDLRGRQGDLLSDDLLGLEWDELVRVCPGDWVLAYDFTEATSGSLLLTDVTGNEGKAAELLERIQQRWQLSGLDIETSATEGGDLVTGKAGLRTVRIGFVSGGRLCLSDRRELAEHVLASPRGGSQSSFASSEICRALHTRQAAAPAGALQFFVDPWQLILKKTATADAAAARRVEFFRRHGFAAVQSITGHVVFDAGLNDAEFQLEVSAEFPLADAAGLLTFLQSTDFRLPDLVPSDISGVTTFHWDLAAALQAYGFVYDDVFGEQYAGAFSDLLLVLAEDPDGPQVDVQADVVDLLSTKITRVRHGAKPPSSGKRREVWMAKSSSPEVTTRAVANFFRGDPDVTSTTVEGVEIWHSRADFPLLGGDSDDPLSYPLDAICIVQGHLVLATDRELAIQLAKRGGGEIKSFADRNWDAESDRPCVAQSWRNFAKAAQTAHQLVAQQQLRSPTSWEQWLLWLLLSSQTEQGWQVTVDGTRLPPFSAIEQYFGFEKTTVAHQENGWQVQGCLIRSLSWASLPETRHQAAPAKEIGP